MSNHKRKEVWTEVVEARWMCDVVMSSGEKGEAIWHIDSDVRGNLSRLFWFK